MRDSHTVFHPGLCVKTHHLVSLHMVNPFISLISFIRSTWKYNFYFIATHFFYLPSVNHCFFPFRFVNRFWFYNFVLLNHSFLRSLLSACLLCFFSFIQTSILEFFHLFLILFKTFFLASSMICRFWLLFHIFSIFS